MIRKLLIFLMLLFSAVAVSHAQDCGPDWISGTGFASAYWLQVDGQVTSRHTNAFTALRALKDTLRARSDADVHVMVDIEGRWQGGCSPPSGVDTVEVCPSGWTCTPPDTTTPPPTDTTAAPSATGVSLMGYAAPDMTHPREHGLHLTWDDNPEVDYWEVYGGRDDGATPGWGPIMVPDNAYRHPLPADADQTRYFSCVVQRIEGRPASGEQCDGMDWAPMMRGQFAVTVNTGGPPFAVGDSVNLNLDRVDGGWADESVTRPDSVVFETGDVRTREGAFPYEFPCDVDDEGCLFAVPAGDSLIVKWTVYPVGGGAMGGSVAYPVESQVGAIYGELSNKVAVTIPEE